MEKQAFLAIISAVSLSAALSSVGVFGHAAPNITAGNVIADSNVHVLIPGSKPRLKVTLPKVSTQISPPAVFNNIPFAKEPLYAFTYHVQGYVIYIYSWRPNLTSQPQDTGMPLDFGVAVQNAQGDFLPTSAVMFSLLGSQNATAAWDNESALPQPSFSNAYISWLQITPTVPNTSALKLDLTVELGTVPGVAKYPNVSSAFTLPLDLPIFTTSQTGLASLTALNLQQVLGFTPRTSPAANSGPGIALFEIGGYSKQSLKYYLSFSGLSAAAMNNTTRLWQPTNSSQSPAYPYSLEAQLDVEMLEGVNPGVHVDSYIYPTNYVGDPLISFLSQQLNSPDKIISISYGFYHQNMQTVDSLLADLTAEGKTIVVASGDQGAFNAGTISAPGVDNLNSSPDVLTVGGLDMTGSTTSNITPSTLNQDPTNASITNMSFKNWGGYAWSGLPQQDVANLFAQTNTAASGGYANAPRPIWQAGNNSPYLGVPDISAIAGSPWVYIAGTSGAISVNPGPMGNNQYIENIMQAGGTSAAAPEIAASLARIQGDLGINGMGLVSPWLYQAASQDPSIFTQPQNGGSNGVYQIPLDSTNTWNPVDGLGIPNMSALKYWLASHWTQNP